MNEKKGCCTTCIHGAKALYQMPCCRCWSISFNGGARGTDWKSKEVKSLMIRVCENCAHESTRHAPGSSCDGCADYANHMTDEELEEFRRLEKEDAAEREEQAKAERTCAGECCAFVVNLGLLNRSFAYTCTYRGCSKYGLIFTDAHLVCAEMYD